MNKEISFIVYGDIEVPGPVLRVEHGNRYGSVPGLDDSELADADELERDVYRQEFGPVLALPVKGNRSGIRPLVDEAGGVDFGAFGTVDFERTVPEFDKVRYKVHKLRDELSDVLIRIGLVKQRLPNRVAYLIVKYLKMGIIELEYVVGHDAWCLARLYLRARRLRNEIWRLEQVSEVRRQRKLEGFLD